MKIVQSNRMALIAVDLQKEYQADGSWPVAGYDRILKNASQMIHAARGRAVSIIHVQAWKKVDGSDSPPLETRDKNGRPLSGIANSIGAEFCESTSPLKNENVVQKQRASGFHKTDLEEKLRKINVNTLLVFGVWTDICVRNTVVDAILLGFRVWLVKDACGSGTEAMHRIAILDLANILQGGCVVDTAAVVSALNDEPYRCWRYQRPSQFLYNLESVNPLYESL